MKGVVVSSSVLRDIDVGFQTQFNRALGRVPFFYKKLCMRVNSTGSENIYAWMASLPAIGEKTAEIIRTRLQVLGHSVVNKEFTGIVQVPRTAIEDDQIGVFGPIAAMWGQRAGQSPDLELISQLSLGFTTFKSYDGKALFADDHKAYKRPAVWSNKGTKKLSAANFQIAYASLRERRDAGNVPLFTLLDPSKVFLVVCSDDEATADSIVKMAKTAAGADNPNFNKAQVVVLPGLQPASADRPWFLLDCGNEIGPLVFQDRVMFELTANLDLKSDKVFTEDLFEWKARGRFAIAAGMPEFGYGSTGADAA
ncbi:MAG: Mu-like prophage major head subunit gpT family protein [Prosthecobacter sp.]|nr:Mu-like prophage major head subunit gpT family protein [Prosthecobacter sp.]